MCACLSTSHNTHRYIHTNNRYNGENAETISTLSSSEFSSLQREYSLSSTFAARIQHVRFPVSSSNVWDSTPPARDSLYNALNNPVYFRLDFQFFHESGMDESISFFSSVLSEDMRQRLRTSLKTENTSYVSVLNAFPRILQLDKTTFSLTSQSESAQTKLSKINQTLWWDVSSSESEENGIGIFVIWNDVATGLAQTIQNSFNASSVITFYATVVLLVSGYIRTALAQPVYDIMYYELPYPDDLLAVIDGITISRHVRSRGHLKDEMGYYNTLIRLYRRPEMLLRITKDRLDVSKDKLD